MSSDNSSTSNWIGGATSGLGVFLRSTHSEQTRFTFEDTLSQIGLGYLPLFLIGLGSLVIAIARPARSTTSLRSRPSRGS